MQDWAWQSVATCAANLPYLANQCSRIHSSNFVLSFSFSGLAGLPHRSSNSGRLAGIGELRQEGSETDINDTARPMPAAFLVEVPERVV